jgi:hypothetical protein
MGGNKDGYNGTRHNATNHFWTKLEAYKICEGWVAKEGYATFLTNMTRRSEP